MQLHAVYYKIHQADEPRMYHAKSCIGKSKPCHIFCPAHICSCIHVASIFAGFLQGFGYQSDCFKCQTVSKRKMRLRNIGFDRMGQSIHSGSCGKGCRHIHHQCRVVQCQIGKAVCIDHQHLYFTNFICYYICSGNF